MGPKCIDDSPSKCDCLLQEYCIRCKEWKLSAFNKQKAGRTDWFRDYKKSDVYVTKERKKKDSK